MKRDLREVEGRHRDVELELRVAWAFLDVVEVEQPRLAVARAERDVRPVGLRHRDALAAEDFSRDAADLDEASVSLDREPRDDLVAPRRRADPRRAERSG